MGVKAQAHDAGFCFTGVMRRSAQTHFGMRDSGCRQNL
jgi:hypothetical protein